MLINITLYLDLKRHSALSILQLQGLPRLLVILNRLLGLLLLLLISPFTYHYHYHSHHYNNHHHHHYYYRHHLYYYFRPWLPLRIGLAFQLIFPSSSFFFLFLVLILYTLLILIVIIHVVWYNKIECQWIPAQETYLFEIRSRREFVRTSQWKKSLPFLYVEESISRNPLITNTQFRRTFQTIRSFLTCHRCFLWQ